MADSKVTELAALSQAVNEDLLTIVTNPNGTPVNKKLSIKNLFANVVSNTVYNANCEVHGEMHVSNSVLRISTSSTPANSTATRLHGVFTWDASWLYITTSNNVTKRIALASF